MVIFLLTGFLGYPSSSIEEGISARTCSYKVAIWNVAARKVVEVQNVTHPYHVLTEDEVDPVTGCSVCLEDQVPIELPGLAEFRLCRKIAHEVKGKLDEFMQGGFPVHSVRGYEVVRSRGDIDEYGNRTILSNHSFGTAIDINRELNGLYDNCTEFGPQCRLLLGGKWRPGVPGTLVENKPVVMAMKELGFKWGGEIMGRQKDFMHFSFTGY